MQNRYYLFLLCFFIFITGCNEKNADIFKFSGTLEMHEYSVGVPVSGRIKKVLVEEGDTVKNGQVIAVLEHYKQAEHDFIRAKVLMDSGSISSQTYEHVKQSMEDQRVLSPIDGTVILKIRKSGEAIGAGMPVAIIGDPCKLWIKIYVPEIIVSRISINQKAKILSDGVNKEVYGYVSFISSKAEFTPRNIQTAEERTVQTFAVKIKINNPDMILHPGVSADVYFEQ